VNIDAIFRQNKWLSRAKGSLMGLAQYTDDGLFSPRKIADALRTTSEEIARTAGLGKDAIQRKDRIRSDKTQRRLREMTEIVNKVEPRFGSALMAYAWYRSEPLSGFSLRQPCNVSVTAEPMRCSTTSTRSTPAFTPDSADALSGSALPRAESGLCA
jgi:hypothetical protein